MQRNAHAEYYIIHETVNIMLDSREYWYFIPPDI